MRAMRILVVEDEQRIANSIKKGLEQERYAGEAMVKTERAVALAGKGLEGDRYATGKGAYSRSKRETVRHVSLIAQEAIDEANRESGLDFQEAETRRNLVVEGVDLNGLAGEIFLVGAVAMLGVELCEPCERPSRLSGKKGFGEAFRGRGGLRANVLSGGEILTGDGVSRMKDGVIEGPGGVRWFEKKIWGEYFDPVGRGSKKYELRLGDFECREGDMLVLREWDPKTSGYTGRVVVKRITYARKFKLEDLFWSREEIQEWGLQVISLE